MKEKPDYEGKGLCSSFSPVGKGYNIAGFPVGKVTIRKYCSTTSVYIVAKRKRIFKRFAIGGAT